MAELPQIRISGPDVTAEHAREVGESFADLFNAVAEANGLPPGMMRVGEVRIACDALDCEATREFDGDATGWWQSEDGRDFCPIHTKTPTQESGE